MKDEIWATIRKMKLGKTTGPDSISVELLEALEDNGADKIITLLNKIYDTCQVPPDISNLYLYHCQRNQWQQSVNCLISALSYEPYHQNTFKNHHDVIRNKIKSEIADEQCDFLEEKEQKMQSTPFIIEQVLKAQKEAYLCFIDFIMYLTEYDMVR